MKRRRYVDLSIAIEHDLPSDPEILRPKIRYMGHEAGAKEMTELFFRGLKKEQLPGGLGWAAEFISLTTHSGTHLDSPLHYHPTMSKGQRSWTIDEIPLEWCHSDGVILDFTHKQDGERITAADVQKELDRIGYRIKPMDIVHHTDRRRPGLGAAGIPCERGRHDPREHPLYPGKRREGRRDRRLELGPAPAFPGQGVPRERGPEHHLGSPFRGDRDEVIVTWRSWPTCLRSADLLAFRCAAFP